MEIYFFVCTAAVDFSYFRSRHARLDPCLSAGGPLRALLGDSYTPIQFLALYWVHRLPVADSGMLKLAVRRERKSRSFWEGRTLPPSGISVLRVPIADSDPLFPVEGCPGRLDVENT